MAENISNLFEFLGGLGMFLYGMHVMADGMQKTAGGRMQKFLGMLTNNRFMAVGLGALITAIIQSSSATTVMVVGFVSAGILNLSQAVGVIMGANIGTTVTAWIVSLGSVSTALSFTKPEFYAALFIGIGAMLVIFTSSQKKRLIGEIFLGLGLLFMGLKYMSGSLAPYTKLAIFADSFRILGSNPLFGILAGCIVTAIIQSSSASVGILQTLAMNGVVNKSAALYITLGQNIGTCVTALISSAGVSKTARRAAVIHLLFNVIGALTFGIAGFILFMLNPGFALEPISSVEISMFHTLFNTTNTLMLFPFGDQLVKLSGIFVKEDEATGEAEEENAVLSTLKHLDARIFETPAFALETAIREVIRMGRIAQGNVRMVVEAALSGDGSRLEQVFKTEKTVNSMQTLLTEYLIKLDNLSLNEEQKLILNNLHFSINDIERIADHAENIGEGVLRLTEKQLAFSEAAISDLTEISSMVNQAVDQALLARQENSMDAVRRVNKCEDEVDFLEDELREKHIIRLSSGDCNPEAGIVFLDILSNLERISDHAKNLADYITKEI